MLVVVLEVSCISRIIPECNVPLSILALSRLTLKEEALSPDVAPFPTVIACRCRFLSVRWSGDLIISAF